MTDPNRVHADRTDWLQHQWLIAGIISSAARFVPIPFIDDAIRSQCRRFVVSRTLAASEASLLASELQPLYGGSTGCVEGCFGLVAKAPLQLLLFPIRKVASILTSVRGVPLEIMRMVLLGRTLRRQLAVGTVDPNQIATMRLAFDESFSRMDFRVTRAAITDALRSVQNWKASAVESARTLSATPGGDDNLPADAKVQTTATKVQAALDRPETIKLFEEFDQRFDAAFNRLKVESHVQ